MALHSKPQSALPQVGRALGPLGLHSEMVLVSPFLRVKILVNLQGRQAGLLDEAFGVRR